MTGYSVHAPEIEGSTENSTSANLAKNQIPTAANTANVAIAHFGTVPPNQK
jgi:hypothetical protein